MLAGTCTCVEALDTLDVVGMVTEEEKIVVDMADNDFEEIIEELVEDVVVTEVVVDLAVVASVKLI